MKHPFDCDRRDASGLRLAARLGHLAQTAIMDRPPSPDGERDGPKSRQAAADAISTFATGLLALAEALEANEAGGAMEGRS